MGSWFPLDKDALEQNEHVWETERERDIEPERERVCVSVSAVNTEWQAMNAM